jgi:hypothetical protein
MPVNVRTLFPLLWIRWRSTNRLLVLCLGVGIGIAAGLWFGWGLSPLQYTETVPSQLEPKYQSEFVMMVAETYDREQDLHAATARLEGLGRADLAGLVREVEQAYAAAGYPSEDRDRLERLARDLAPLSIPAQTTQ